MVVEGVLVVPLFMGLVLFFGQVLLYHYTVAYLRQGVDSFLTLTATVHGVAGDLPDLPAYFSSTLTEGLLWKHLTQDGVLKKDRLRVDAGVEGSVGFVVVEYGYLVPLVGEFPIVVRVERRFW